MLRCKWACDRPSSYSDINAVIIDREAREIMHLVASVRLSVRLSVWVYSGHIIQVA